MSSQPFNMLEAQTAIIERLGFATQKEQNGVPGWCRKIGTVQTMSTVEELTQNCPAIFVVYDGERVTDTSDTQTIEAHKWLVILVVRNAADQRTADNLNNDAGVFMPRIKAAIKGFVVPGTMGVMKQVSPPRPFYSSGYAYYPAAFEVKVLFSNQFGVGGGRPSKISMPFTPTTINK